MLIVNTIGISILAVFLLFIFQKKGKMMSDYLLITTIALISIIFISNLWISQELNPVNFILEKLISFFILPAFLTYAMLLISEDNKWRKEWWWFGLFAIAFSIFIFIDFAFLTDYNEESLRTQYGTPASMYQFFYRGGNLFVFFALIWFLRKMRQYRQKIKENYSFIETIRFRWLSTFAWIYLINNGFILIISLLYSYAHIGNLEALYLATYISIVLSLFYLCYNGIRQYSFVEFNHFIGLDSKVINASKATAATPASNPTMKYKSSSLSEEEIASIFKALKQLFEKEEIYLDPQLKIHDLASKLAVTTHNVSQAINSKAGKPFYDFVNQYRVAHFKKLLSDPENRKYTILALGIESGFNSKATLNRIFKQQIGVSPKAFQLAALQSP